MAIDKPASASVPADDLPAVRSVGVADLKDALAKGLDDFWAMPTHVIFVAMIYPIAGLVLSRLAFGYNLIPLLFPLAAGFALIGPIAALGLYELSRRRERGLPTSWTNAFDVLRSPSLGAILLLGVILFAIFIAWIIAAQTIYTRYFGIHPPESFSGFFDQIFTHPEGLRFILVGNAVGFGFALLVLALSVVSFPLLLDRKTSAIVAVVTSIRAFLRNPVSLLIWGFVIASALFLGALPFLIGLAVALPVLGHASWHLYRKVVESPR